MSIESIIEAALSLPEAKVRWLIPETYTLLRGTLWTGPPTDGRGQPVLVIPLPEDLQLSLSDD